MTIQPIKYKIWWETSVASMNVETWPQTERLIYCIISHLPPLGDSTSCSTFRQYMQSFSQLYFVIWNHINYIYPNKTRKGKIVYWFPHYNTETSCCIFWLGGYMSQKLTIFVAIKEFAWFKCIFFLVEMNALFSIYAK